jgi:alkaline phosphatase D
MMMTKRSLLAVFIVWLIINISALSTEAIAQQSKLQAGPMLGYVEMMETGIWVQTTEPAAVTLNYWKSEDGEKSAQMAKVSTDKASFLIAKFLLTNLDFGTEYSYELAINGKKLSFDYPLTFTTKEHWMWRKPAPDFRFAVGSCLYINDEKFDRPGTPYGGEYEILTSIADQNPDFMIWTGDNVYYREPDFYSKSGLNYRNKHTRSISEMQRLLATSAHYATWDDHDYGPNDSSREYRLKEEALELFQAYWFNPSYGHDGTKGVFTKFDWSDVDFILTDNRYHRAPNDINDADKDYWGAEQLQWIKDQLINSRATFKILVNGNQSVNMNNPYEGLQAYKREQNELLSFIKDQEIEGVVFFSGDRHHTELLKFEQDGMYPLYEFTNSPLTAGFNSNLRSEENNPLRVEGTKVNDSRSYGIVEVKGERDNRQMIIKTYDTDGELRWEYVISEEELTFGNGE